MNRSKLVAKLNEEFPQFTRQDVEVAVSTILNEMNNALAVGHRIEIRGFGSFAVVHRAARLGRNPRTGEPVYIPQRRAPHFKTGKALREGISQRTSVLPDAPQD